MSKLHELIAFELNEVGTAEQPLGSNIIKYNDWYWDGDVSGQSASSSYRAQSSLYPWCCVYQVYCFNMVGLDKLMTFVAHCDGIKRLAVDSGRWFTSDYRIGDLVLFDYDGNCSYDHIGLIVEDNGNGRYTTVEGNYSDRVSKVSRKRSEFAGCYRPDYASIDPDGEEAGECADDSADDMAADVTYQVELQGLTKGMVSESVRAMQMLLIGRGCSCGIDGADGDFGNNTLNALKIFQSKHRLDCTGICDGDTWSALIN